MESFRYSIFAAQKSSLRHGTEENKSSSVPFLASSTGFPLLFFQIFSLEMRRDIMYSLFDIIILCEYLELTPGLEFVGLD